MPNRPLTAKQQSFIDYFAEPTSETYNNVTQSMIRAGYSARTADNNTNQVMGNNGIRAGIKAYKDKMRAETVRTVQSIDQMQQSAYDLAMQNNQPSAAVSAAQAIARLYGMDKQTTVSERTPDQPEGKEAEVLTGLNKQYKVKLSGTG